MFLLEKKNMRNKTFSPTIGLIEQVAKKGCRLTDIGDAQNQLCTVLSNLLLLTLL